MDKDNGRDIALSRLKYLYKFNLLNAEEIELLKNKLWEKVDKYGLAEIPKNYSKNYLLDLPAPENIDLHKLIKEYILSLDIPKQPNGVYFSNTGNKPLMLLELQWCTYCIENGNGVRWDSDEISKIIDKVFNAWNSDKKYIESLNDTGAKNIIFNKYQTTDNILAKAIYSNKSKTKDGEKILCLADDFKKYGLPYMQLNLLLHLLK